MANIQVTAGSGLNDARSESCIVIDPNDTQHMVAASKKFRDFHNYDFTIATSYSIDGGETWRPSGDLPLMPGWTGITDPTMTWDDAGNVFLVGLAFDSPPDIRFIAIATYKSVDGGASWRFSPNDPMKQPIHSSISDDKPWMAADTNPASPFHGRVYVTWDDVQGAAVLRFARTLDGGATWIGTGASPAGSIIAQGSELSEINVAPDGTIYVVARTDKSITMFVSSDGGNSFSRAATDPASDITTIESRLPSGRFPGAKFRVLTLPTASAGAGQRVIAAWSDFRDGVARIYSALSTDGGNTWLTGFSGNPLLPLAHIPPDEQHFHPQIVIDSQGTVGCAFYRMKPSGTGMSIDVILAQSSDGGLTFPDVRVVTDRGWDPETDAPWTRGNPALTFIGEYFGLDASCFGFHPLWTDTRTGIQELWTDIVYRAIRFRAVYSQGDPGAGIDGYDLLKPEDRAFAFDYDSSGKLDHMVLYRPGSGAIYILENRGGVFTSVYAEGDPGRGIGDFDLLDSADRAFAFDYDSSGKLDHLVLYRPGDGAIHILKRSGANFVSVYKDKGIGGFDLLRPEDRAFAFDYDGSGKLDHLVLYRPGDGSIFIVKRSGANFVAVYHDKGIGGFDLLRPEDRAFAFDYDGTGRLDHLVLYRPGDGSIFILKRSGVNFVQAYKGNGIGGYDLKDPNDRICAFDFTSGGKRDHLVCYRPGDGTIWILRRGGGFMPVHKGKGIGGFDLLKAEDHAFAFDYDGSGKLDHLVLYRPGTGAIYIVRSNLDTCRGKRPNVDPPGPAKLAPDA